MALRTKVVLGKRKKHSFYVPDKANIMEHTTCESIMLFGGANRVGTHNYRLFYGVGVVHRISKGERFDCVYINFGSGKLRAVLVQSNHARRQISTLKRGQFCQVYGHGRTYPYTMVRGKQKWVVRRWLFFARALQGWYLPKMVDIKRIGDDEFIELNERELETYSNILDEIEKETPPISKNEVDD